MRPCERVRVAPCTAHDALFHWIDGESAHQPVFVYLDPEPAPGRLFAAYQGELGSAVSERVRSRRLIRYEAPLLTGDAVNALMRRADVQELAARVVRGYSHGWDGAGRVGLFDADAVSAHDALTVIIDEAEGAERLVVFDAAAFFELDMDALRAKAQAHRWDAFDLVAYLRAKAAPAVLRGAERFARAIVGGAL